MHVISLLPVCIIVLKVLVIQVKSQHSGIMIEPKVIIGAFYPFHLFWGKFWKALWTNVEIHYV